MNDVTLPTGESVPALGVGTWRMGEDAGTSAQEVTALRHAMDRGIRLIDTAEMYGSGGAEEIVAEAVAARRDQVFIVSKILPQNASAIGTIEACERSLARLKSDYIDLYLLHWPGDTRFAEVADAFGRLKQAGKIRHWGVSNFNTKDMTELLDLEQGGACVANQVLYHLGERGVEWQLLPFCQSRSIPIMAYTPFGGPSVLADPAVAAIAQKHGTGPGAVALAWLLRNKGVIVIPKATQLPHVDEIARAREIALDAEDLGALDQSFPPPGGPNKFAAAQGASRRTGA